MGECSNWDGNWCFRVVKGCDVVFCCDAKVVGVVVILVVDGNWK